MKYFIDEKTRVAEKRGTNFYEFQKGYNDEEYWKEDSLLLDYFWANEVGVTEVLYKYIPDFDEIGAGNWATKKDWENLWAYASTQTGVIREVFEELKPWMDECFKEFDEFEIIGM